MSFRKKTRQANGLSVCDLLRIEVVFDGRLTEWKGASL